MVTPGELTLEQTAAAIEAVSARYAERFGIRRDVDWGVMKLAEEIGELTQAHLKLTGQARAKSGDEPQRLRERFEDEMADVLGQLFVLARLTGADLPAALDRKWLRWHPSRLSHEAYLEIRDVDSPRE
jgi:NTP pyrophosphatase (non-canonical NTP hydrolase)